MNYKLFVFLFALFLICTPNFLLKKKLIFQEIVYSALFSIILYFTYDIMKINLETFWYECQGKLSKTTSKIKKTIIFKESEMCDLPPGVQINDAIYRGQGDDKIIRSINVTDIVKKLYSEKGKFHISNKNMQSDPYPNMYKNLVVTYTIV